MLLQLTHLGGPRWVVKQELFAEPRGPEWQAAQPERPAVLHQDQLDAAAADVDQEVRSTIQPEGVACGAVDQASFLGTRDHAHGELGLAPQAPHECGAVARLAHGARGHDPQAFDVAGARQAAEGGERAGGEMHGFGREMAGGERASSETHHLLHAVDDLDVPVCADVRDHHVERVGPDVDRRQAHCVMLTAAFAVSAWGPLRGFAARWTKRSGGGLGGSSATGSDGPASALRRS